MFDVLHHWGVGGRYRDELIAKVISIEDEIEAFESERRAELELQRQLQRQSERTR